MSGERRTDQATLDRALALLDHELAGLRLDQPLKIRAVGGYAMLKHGMRTDPDRALTADIDSLTEDYSRQVKEAIALVGEKLGIDRAWLNNDAAADEDFGGAGYTALKVDAHWQDMPAGLPALANIDMAMADVPTLTRMKIAAVEDSYLSDRAQDLPDLHELLEHQGITTFAQFARAYPDPDAEHARARSIVKGMLSPQRRTGSLASALGRQDNGPVSGTAAAANAASSTTLAASSTAGSPDPDELLSTGAIASAAAGADPDTVDELSDEALLSGFDDPYTDSGADDPLDGLYSSADYSSADHRGDDYYY